MRLEAAAPSAHVAGSGGRQRGGRGPHRSANGDIANKIGTYTVAVPAHRHKVPFYVAAPLSTIDRATPTGAAIPIKERKPLEVTEVFGIRIAPEETEAVNFAFDVTPAELITAIITEVGVLRAP